MKKEFFALAMMFAIASTALAQEKLGHVNTNELLTVMPEIKKLETDLKSYQQQLEQQSQSMLTEYQSKVSEFQQQETLMADAIKEVKIKEIQDLEQRIQQFQASAQEKLATKQQELYTPIQTKVKEAIEAVAKDKGYTYIFDLSLGAVLYAQDSKDITPSVKAKLGL